MPNLVKPEPSKFTAFCTNYSLVGDWFGFSALFDDFNQHKYQHCSPNLKFKNLSIVLNDTEYDIQLK